MVLTFLAGGAVGYALATRTGRKRYRDLVRVSRRVAGSQTAQAAAGMLRAQVDTAKAQARHVMADRLHSR